jgi:hypothetical protein
MTTVVSDIRTVPVGEDLSKSDIHFQVVRGFEQMKRADVPVLNNSVALTTGEWAVLDTATGKAKRPSTSPVGHSYPVFSGTDRFDARATGAVTLIMNSLIVVKSDKYDLTAAPYTVGDYLTVKSLGGGEAQVTKQSGTEPKLARVLEVGTGYLVYETLPA